MTRVIDHHVPRKIAGVRIGMCVIAYIANAVRRQVMLENIHNVIANGRRNPGIDAVRDNVIEPAEGGVHIHDVMMEQPDIVQPKRPDIAHTALNGEAAQINTDELAAGILKGHWEQVATRPAPELQDATL